MTFHDCNRATWENRRTLGQRLLCVLALFCVSVAARAGETLVRFYLPDPFNTGCASTIYSGCPSSDGKPIVWAGCGGIHFSDPVPRGSKVTRMDVRVGIRGRYIEGPPETVLWALNHTLSQPERVMGMAEVPIGSGAHCTPDLFQKLSIAGMSYENGIPFYLYGGRNFAQVRSPDVNRTTDFDSMEITFHYEPEAVVEFDLSASDPETERRVLIHKYGQNDVYFSSAQEALRNTPEGADGRIEVRGRATSVDGAALSGKKIHLRAGDPPDTAPYVPVADRVAGDNADKGGGRFEEKNEEGETLLVKTTSVVTDSSGRFRVVFRVSQNVAGDNYRIEASTAADFGNTSSCGPGNGCSSSGTLVAWKRVYLETGRMFRRGSYIRENVEPGATQVEVFDVTPFQAGDRIVLIHAPLSRIEPSSPSTEYQVVERVIAPDGVKRAAVGLAGRLTFSVALPTPFQGPGMEEFPPYPSLVADFVGIVTGDPQKDYFEPNVSYLKGLFGDAFVDYVVMAPMSLPLVKTLQERLDDLADPDETHRYAQRWYRHSGYRNHQLLFGSRESSSAKNGARGITRTISGLSYSHVMVQKILGALGSTNSRRLLGEIVAHEVAHQWHVDRWSSHTTNGEHCSSFNYYDNPAKSCLMRDSYENGGTTLPEFYDDVVRFHYVPQSAGVDSEYRWIRERCDPVPIRYPAPNASFDWWAVPPLPCR